MDRRPGVFGNRFRLDYGRMRFSGAIAVALLIANTGFAAEIPQADRRSGYDFMKPDTKAMQDEDTANPGLLWVLDGEALWKRKAGSANKACADCHNDAEASMKGVAAHYPAFDKALGRPVNLEQRINLCRTDHQQASPLPYESRDLLALSAFVARQSNGVAIEPSKDPELAPFVAKGHALFTQRQGQLNLACANCHDDNWDKRLAGSPSRKDSQRAIRCIGWSGSRWGRCSGGCAPASRASGHRPMTSVRRNWWTWNCI